MAVSTVKRSGTTNIHCVWNFSRKPGRHALLKRDQTFKAKCKVVISLPIRRHDLRINLLLHLHLNWLVRELLAGNNGQCP